MPDFRFLSADVARAVHDRQLAEHGGLAGVKDEGLLESAIARPLNKAAYGEDDPCALAAAYAFGIARNHPFADGNKRTAWVMARLFLRLNEVPLSFDKADAIRTMVALAAGELSEERSRIGCVCTSHPADSRNTRRSLDSGGHLSSPGT